MNKGLRTILLVILCLTAVRASCEELSKCDNTLEYLYNYYYDQGALEEQPPALDTTSGKGNAADSTIRDGSSVSVDRTSTDSSGNEGQRKEIIAGKEPTEDSVVTVFPRTPFELTGFDPLNNSSLYFVDSVPYIRVFMQYSGDGTDLNALGVETSDIIAGRLVASFPLSILPKVNALQTVIRVSSGGKVELNELHDQSINDSLDLETFVELHKYSYSIDTTDSVPTIYAMIFTNGNYNQLDSLGIDTCSKLGTTVCAKIPIALIRLINSLESVERIIFPSRVRPNAD